MCGISVIINAANQPVDSGLLKCMTDKVVHRGPDEEGYYLGSDFGMGHRRLSIIDLSEAGRQPMKRQGDCIVFNGMIYNYVELREELEEYGYHFKSQTDTEVLVYACKHWGIDAFNKLNGMWAFAWYRSSTNEIILSRDRYGIKPLYFTEVNGMFAAASEIKQFTCLPGFTNRLNYSTTINFLVHGLTNYSGATFFEGVQALLPGHYLTFNLRSRQYTVKQWYDLRQKCVPKKIGNRSPFRIIRQLFHESIRLRMRSDVRLGSCLSGGLDSSAIVQTVHTTRLASEDFTTVTSCYKDKKYDEQTYSDAVTSNTGFQALKVYPNLDDLIDKGVFDKMLYYQDQPFATGSHFSEYQVFKTAREHGITVMLDGQGSDEYLCGYNEYYITYLKQLLHKGHLLGFVRNIRNKAKLDNISVLKACREYFRSVYWFSFVHKMKRVMGRTDHTWLNRLGNQLAAKELVHFDESNVRQLSFNQMLYSSLPLQLHSEDRNSMMFSIESRLPFLDHRLVEFAIGLPDKLKIRDGYSKYVLRGAISDMPEMIRNRTDKMGFVAPDEPWVRQNHQRLRLELVDAVQTIGIVSEEILHRFDKFIKGRRNYEPIFFRVIALNRFIRVFNMRLANDTAVADKPFTSRIMKPANPPAEQSEQLA